MDRASRDRRWFKTGWAVLGALAIGLQAGTAPVGWWTFEDSNQPLRAAAGEDLILVGVPPVHRASLADEQGLALSGVITTVRGTGNHLLANHQIGANGGGRRVNQYTLLFDLLIPGPGQWRCLYQTAANNQGDGEYFVHNADNRVGRSTLGYSDQPLPGNRWQRLAIAVDLTSDGSCTTWVNGDLFTTHTRPAFDGEYALEPARLLFFADDNDENGPLAVGMVALFDTRLSDDLIAALGGPGRPVVPDPDNLPPHIQSPPSGPTHVGTGESATFSFVAVDPDGDDVELQIDWGNGVRSAWSDPGRPGTPQTLAGTWALPGTYRLRARARDVRGGLSPWADLHEIEVTGPPRVAFVTPPYLQNRSESSMVIMTELDADLPLVLQQGRTPAYGATVPMESVASGGGTFFLRGVLTGLEPGTTYHYRLASVEGHGMTGDATFRTAPDRWEDFSFAALGDTQTTNGGVWQADPWEPGRSMLHHMVAREVAFGLGLGDHASDGDSYQSTRNAHLDRWAAILGPRAPFFIAWGNHDGNSPNHPLRLSADMPSRWQTATSPSVRTPGYGNFSFSYAGVFFVCLDHFQIHNRPANDPGNDLTNGWLDARLASPEAREARFRIVAVHVPPFCERWIDGNAALRAHLVPKLEQYGVDLCFSGHMHGYERGQLNGVHYIIAGGGSYLDFSEPLVRDWPHLFVGGIHDGQPAHVPGFYARQSVFGILGPPEPILGGLFHGYAEVTVRDRYLRLDMHAFHADGSYNGILDVLEIGVDPGPDTDGDGMRDAWELAHGLDPHDPTDAHLDADGDGITNLEEFLAGTDPTDASSRLAIVSLERRDDRLLLRWSSVAGRRYRIEWSPDLVSWSRIERTPGHPLTITAGEGSVTGALIEPSASAPDPLFLRVRAVPF